MERAKLNEELTAARTKPASDREKELTMQLIKVRKSGLGRTGRGIKCIDADFFCREIM